MTAMATACLRGPEHQHRLAGVLHGYLVYHEGSRVLSEEVGCDDCQKRCVSLPGHCQGTDNHLLNRAKLFGARDPLTQAAGDHFPRSNMLPASTSGLVEESDDSSPLPSPMTCQIGKLFDRKKRYYE
jgi:hypothetical protein